MADTEMTIPFVSFTLFQSSGEVTAAVATRKGGVSEAPFDTLNMSFSVGDKPEAVRENRRRFLTLLGMDPASAVSCRQVHGSHIEVVDGSFRGRGAENAASAIPDCDGLLTGESNVPLMMNFADCTPLLFYDPVHRAVGAAHGGWRGTVLDIGGHMVRLMRARFGTDPADLLVGIGPAIGRCCFEVGEDVVAAFARLFGEQDMTELAAEKGGGKYLFDLPEANRRLLLRAGVRPSHIERSEYCTYCRDDLFFSHRKSGGCTGRHAAVIMRR